jgi:hypothetical protein
MRLDLQPTDIPFIIFMLTDSTQFAREASPEIWRRYLGLVLDGLRPERTGVTPLRYRRCFLRRWKRRCAGARHGMRGCVT